MLSRTLLSLLILPCLVLPAFCQDSESSTPSMPAGIDLQDGDTFVFLGDSITHQRLYTQYVETFFYQRYPDRRINFHNAGIGGAQAWDALARTGRDVLDYKPRYVSILLGMNDGRYRPFDAEIFANYQKDMLTLVSRLRAGGATPILMSPTMFDARAARNSRRQRDPDMLQQYNSVLAYYGRWLQDVALETGTAYVDMYGPLNDLTVEAREEEPGFTLIRDAIHPDPPGQIVMAYAMIDDLGQRKALSNIRIQPVRGELRASANGGKVSDLQKTENGLSFSWLADGLPWVLPPEAQQGVDLLRLGHKATREGLEIHGLPAGRYDVLIDGELVGTWPHTTLARHIELQGNEKTPQYQQALKVALLNKQKNEGPVRKLRDGWRPFQNWARMERTLDSKALSPAPHVELAEKAATVRNNLKNLDSLILEAEAEADKIEDEIYRVNQPVVRRFEIRRAEK